MEKIEKINFTNEEFIYEIMALTEKKYGSFCNGKLCIGRHCITGEKNPEIGKEVFEKGLNILSGSSLYTVTPLGRLDRNEVHSIFNQKIEWLPKDSWKSGVLVAMPVEIIRSTGESIYLGEITSQYESNKYCPSSVADKLCSDTHSVDKHFVLGYFEKGENETIDFEFNPNYFGFKTSEIQDKLFDSIQNTIKEKMQLPVFSANMSSDEVNKFREKLSSIEIPYSNNYLLKTLDQMINENNYFNSNKHSHTI